MSFSLCLCLSVVGLALSTDMLIDLRANLSRPLGHFERRSSGILHSFNSTFPPSDTVRPLHLHMYRGPERFRLYNDYNCSKLPCPWLFANVNRLESMGTNIQFLLSDIYFAWRSHIGLPDSLLPGDNNNFTLWEKVVTFSVKWALALGHEDIMWDIYNEPNIGFENRSVFQFYDVWTRAYEIIKSFKSDLIVIGPSVADLGWEDKSFPWIRKFLLTQSKRDLLPDILCWHVGHSNGSVLVQQHQQIRSFLVAHNLSLHKIAHNEVIGPDASLSPGVCVSFLANLERLNVDHACRACWREYNPVSDKRYDSCWDQTLDGLLTTDGLFEPRSAWWVYRWYGEMNGHTFSLEGEMLPNGMDGLVVYNGSTIMAMFGCIGDTADALAINFTVVNVNTWKSADLTAWWLPFTEMEPLLSPAVVQTQVIDIKDDQLVVTLPHIHSNEAIFLQSRISNPFRLARESMGWSSLLHASRNGLDIRG